MLRMQSWWNKHVYLFSSVNDSIDWVSSKWTTHTMFHIWTFKYILQAQMYNEPSNPRLNKLWWRKFASLVEGRDMGWGGEPSQPWCSFLHIKHALIAYIELLAVSVKSLYPFKCKYFRISQVSSTWILKPRHSSLWANIIAHLGHYIFIQIMGTIEAAACWS